MSYVEDCSPDCDERAKCPDAGQPMHWTCGWCAEHERPVHHCTPECWVGVKPDATWVSL